MYHVHCQLITRKERLPREVSLSCLSRHSGSQNYKYDAFHSDLSLYIKYWCVGCVFCVRSLCCVLRCYMSHIQQSTVAVSVTSPPLEGYPGQSGDTADPGPDCSGQPGSSPQPVRQMVFSNGGRAGGRHSGKIVGERGSKGRGGFLAWGLILWCCAMPVLKDWGSTRHNAGNEHSALISRARTGIYKGAAIFSPQNIIMLTNQNSLSVWVVITCQSQYCS